MRDGVEADTALSIPQSIFPTLEKNASFITPAAKANGVIFYIAHSDNVFVHGTYCERPPPTNKNHYQDPDPDAQSLLPKRVSFSFDGLG